MLDVFAVDFNTTLPKFNTFTTGEWAWINVNVPSTYSQQFGNKQQGICRYCTAYFRQTILDWEIATVSLACRLEYVDWNLGEI